MSQTMIRWFAQNGIAANFLMLAIVVAGDVHRLLSNSIGGDTQAKLFEPSILK